MAQVNTKRKNTFNIIECSGIFEEKISDEQFQYQILDAVKTRAERRAIENADEIIQEKINNLEERIKDLEKENAKKEQECMIDNIKLQNCLPMGLLLCLFLTSGIVISCATIVIVQLMSDIKLVDYYVLLFVLLGGIGLFHTSLSTIKGWKRYLNNEDR